MSTVIPTAIALDYDNTYSRDPEGWAMFARMMIGRGHDVRIVTARDERHDRTQPLIDAEKVLPVIYSRGVAKRFYCQNFVDDFNPVVYIDDKPENIGGNSTATPEILAQWRLERDH